ncbi:MAG TPA: hypothetical protein VGS21_05660, partial [Acidimicrobiales bacterium]|nr:hypothetical protein [Acidimicrobiales bacterium]
MTLTAGTLERRIELVMGTVVTFDVKLDGPEAALALPGALAKARAVLHRADAVFSLWKHDSPMNRLRRGDIGIDDAPL